MTTRVHINKTCFSLKLHHKLHKRLLTNVADAVAAELVVGHKSHLPLLLVGRLAHRPAVGREGLR